MHAKRFLHKLLSKTIHKSRLTQLIRLVETVMQTKELSLSKVGRALKSQSQERSNIRAVDRFLSNTYYQNNSREVYQQIINLVIGSKKQPILIVDWTKLPNTNHEALRASYFVEGRALTLYEEVHSSQVTGNADVHNEFLKVLYEMIPVNCLPIIVTDAGFKNPWFKAVLKYGWDYVGRIRGKTHYGEDSVYREISALFDKATTTPRYLGKKQLTKKNALDTNFYVVRMKLKGRSKFKKNGCKSEHKDSKGYSRSYREPWILVSSLTGQAKKVVNIYKQRMTIEEAFRDMKSSKYGFNMANNKTLRPKRLNAWLLLASLASLLAWIIGYNAEKQQLHYRFQANSIRYRRVLSFFFLGCQVIRKAMKIPIQYKGIFDQEALLQ